MKTGITGRPQRKGAFVGLKDLVRPQQLPSLAAWYDVSDLSSLIYDGSNRVSLLADKSGNSNVNVLALNGAVGNDASTTKYIPGAGVFRVEQRVLLNSYTSRQGLVNVYNSSGSQGSWNIELAATTGFLTINLTSDGGVGGLQTIVADAALTSATEYWAVEIDLVGGTVDFETSTDGTTWAALGTQQTFTPLTLFNNNQLLRVGSLNAGTAIPAAGLFYWTKLYFNGALVRNFDPSSAAKLAATFVAPTTGETWTINTSGATGARICGARDLYQGTVANQPIYLPWSGTNYGWLNGTSGNYFSTPDSVPLSITGDIDIRARLALNDWTPTAPNVIAAKWTETGNQRSYLFWVATSGALEFYVSTTGADATNVTSSAAPTVSNFGSIWVRVTRVQSSGVVTFYTSADGVAWTQLGTTSVLSAGSAIFDGTSVLEVGSRNAGAQTVASGLIYRAQIYNGIAGTLVFDFNPSAYTSGTTFPDSSANAATITLNGGSTIVTRTCLYFDGSNDYLKAAAFSLSQPETVYFVGSQVTWTSADSIHAGNDNISGLLSQNTSEPNLRIFSGASLGLLSVPLNTTSVISEVHNGATSQLRLNRTTGITGDAGTNAMNGFTLGARGDGSTNANITAFEILIYNAAQNITFWDRVFLWLARKWGIPIT